MKRWVLLMAAFLLTGGCGIPTDPMGTLERVRGGVLRVGMTEADPWARRDGRARSGVEVELMSRFAESLGARVEWTDGSEEELFEQLHADRLDLVIGGITAKSPWQGKAAFTRRSVTVISVFGQPEKAAPWVRTISSRSSTSSCKSDSRRSRAAVGDLMDERATRYDSNEPHPLIDRLRAELDGLPWVEEARVRVREQGHVFHVEAFVVPAEAGCAVEALGRATAPPRPGLEDPRCVTSATRLAPRRHLVLSAV